MPASTGIGAFFEEYCIGHFSNKRCPLLFEYAVRDARNGGIFAEFADQDPLASPIAFNRFVRSRLAGAPISAARGSRFKDDHNDTCMYIERSKNLNVVAYTANYEGTPYFLTTRTTDANANAVSTSSDQAETFLQPPRGPRTLTDADPLRAYWIKIEAEHVARRRGRGEMEDICGLSTIEKKLAYGCKTSSFGPKGEPKLLSDMFGKQLASLDMRADVLANIDAWYKAFQPCNAAFVAMSSWHGVLFSLPPLPEAGSASSGADAEDGGASSSSTGFPRPDTTVPVMFATINKEMCVICKVYVKSIEPKHFYQLPSVEYVEVFGVSLETGEETYEKRKP